MGAWLGGAFGIFLLRQFFLAIPRELADAARVDGANPWQIFTKRLRAAGPAGARHAGDLHLHVDLERPAQPAHLPAATWTSTRRPWASPSSRASTWASGRR
ncbi:MAG: ABC transporter permease subunit [Rhodopseudomonas palustris]|nr:ABC transporter permease subunit [Rhodopseudomonas palustris]